VRPHPGLVLLVCIGHFGVRGIAVLEGVQLADLRGRGVREEDIVVFPLAGALDERPFQTWQDCRMRVLKHDSASAGEREVSTSVAIHAVRAELHLGNIGEATHLQFLEVCLVLTYQCNKVNYSA